MAVTEGRHLSTPDCSATLADRRVSEVGLVRNFRTLPDYNYFDRRVLLLNCCWRALLRSCPQLAPPPPPTGNLGKLASHHRSGCYSVHCSVHWPALGSEADYPLSATIAGALNGSTDYR